jgi:hypothetical protein
MQRFQFDPDSDLKRLYRAFQDAPAFLVPAPLQECFATARAKPDSFRNHRPLLAISLGGSTTSAMLASVADGLPAVHHATERRNPSAPLPLARYLDELLLSEPPFADYLRNDPDPVIGISIAVMVRDGVPYHPSKFATIEGLVARDLATQSPTHHLGQNLNAWLASHGLRPARVFYEGDAPVAHLGGVGLSALAPDDRSLLLVCGNGMACADYERFIVCGMFCCLCEDNPELYRPADMENGQYQYLVAGKGIYKVLRRAAELDGLDVARFFASSHDSVHVYHLWAGKMTPRLREVETALGEAAFRRLQAMARAIVPRGIAALANSILCSLSLNGPAPSGRGYQLFLEGSIATDPDIVPALEKELRRQIANRPLWDELGATPPAPPTLAPRLRAPVPARGVSPDQLKKVDMSLIGALFLGAIRSACNEETPA